MQKLSKFKVIKEVFNRLPDHFHPDCEEWLNEKYDRIFKILIDEFGVDTIADMITDHPTKGYFVRYVDDKAPELIAEIHRNIIEQEKLKAL